MSCIHITRELSMHFFLFNCSFKLSGRIDILILTYGTLNFDCMLALQNHVFFLFLSGKSSLFCPASKLKQVGHYDQIY